MNRHLAGLFCWFILTIGGGAVLCGQNTTPRAHAASTVTHRAGGYLGVGVVEIDESRAKALKLKEAYGVELITVEEGSPAAKAGLQKSDVVLEFNGARVESAEHFVRLVRDAVPNHKVTLKIVRGGLPQTLTATMGARNVTVWSSNGLGDSLYLALPELPEMPEKPEAPETPEMPETPSFHFDVPHPVLSWRQSTIGIEAEPLSAQLADFFGVKNGVLVRSVFKGSAAEKAGLKAGDVITRVDANGVGSPEELSRQLHERWQKDAVVLGLMRNHREMTLAVTAAQRRPRPWNEDVPIQGGK